ncbi:DrmB family protein [Alkalihalobacterium sp. APHAB7]|uniref:DrmB family protein n=1 Tax=Alkalihalobacterium sp. APHAB7 TaxID=3402081 RepID=UPI003AAEBEFE
MKSPGGVRASQLITTFGPGSIVDFRSDSVMIMGLDKWSNRPEDYYIVQEPRLQTRLNVSSFRQPRSFGNRGGIPAISFPKYRVCSECKALKADFQKDKKGQYVCSCKGKGVVTYPARFISSCTNGHIQDFPWIEWCHKGEDVCSNPSLRLITRGQSSSLDDIVVRCSCGAHNHLGGALKKGAFSKINVECKGHSPWLGTSGGCDRKARGLQRGASNVYFSSTISALSIPPWTDDIQQLVSSQWNRILSNINRRGLENVELILDVLFPEANEQELKKIFQAIIDQYRMSQKGTDIHYEEWKAFQDTKKVTKHFHIEEEEVHSAISKFVERIVLAHRLREVRVLRGFTRIDYPDPYDTSEVGYSKLSNTDKDWLPAVEVLGEGIFIQLNENSLKEWEEKVNEHGRYKSLLKRYQDWRLEKGWEEDDKFSPRFILLHSLSHALIQELSLSSGYSSNSIREKIYASPDMCGILLYTASADSDGSLGGIIQQGRKDQFNKLLHQTINRAKICSSDPLCSESENLVENSLNLAACHACQLVAETSCEWSNRLLDRLSLFQSEENEIGFFDL